MRGRWHVCYGSGLSIIIIVQIFLSLHVNIRSQELLVPAHNVDYNFVS